MLVGGTATHNLTGMVGATESSISIEELNRSARIGWRDNSSELQKINRRSTTRRVYIGDWVGAGCKSCDRGSYGCLVNGLWYDSGCVTAVAIAVTSRYRMRSCRQNVRLI